MTICDLLELKLKLKINGRSKAAGSQDRLPNGTSAGGASQNSGFRFFPSSTSRVSGFAGQFQTRVANGKFLQLLIIPLPLHDYPSTNLSIP
jgi:hypothetical protein